MRSAKRPDMGGFCVVAGIMGSVQRYDHRSGGRHDDGKVQRLIERLTSEVGECGTLEAMAREVGLSHRQLNRRFREATGLSQQQYLMRVRIEEACVRLRGSDDALCDIAFGLGFSDQSAFTAQFRKRMGLTPRQYRIEFA